MTNKQAIVIKEVLENPGISMAKAMRRARYKANTIVDPSNVTNSKAWKQIMGKYLPDHKLFKTHEEALKATKWNDFTGEREEDHSIRLKAVDMAYKLKGRGNDSVSNTQINISFDGSGYIPPDNVLGLKPTLKRK